MASEGSLTTAGAALLQKASQQYLACRRQVSEKVDEVKKLETDMQEVFEKIRSMGTKSDTSVGRLELSIMSVEGEELVEGTVIHVEIDPEYEEDDVEEVEEPAVAAETPENAERAEDETATVEKTEETKVDANVEAKKAAKEPRAPRSVQWSDAAAFPKTFVFDPVQSREAVVTISVLAPKAENGEEETEPLKEVEILVSSLFETGVLDKWYELKKEAEVKIEETTITEIIEESVVADKEPVVSEEEVAVEEQTSEKVETADHDESKETEGEEPLAEAVKEVAVAEEFVVEESVVSVVETTTEKIARFHVKANFTLSEMEDLTQTAVRMARRKQEAENMLVDLERQAASLRTKYERLKNASQRPTGNAAASTRGSLLSSTRVGGRGLGGFGVKPRVEKTRYQKVKDSVSSVLTPQRQTVLKSVTMFAASVALFHYQGHNLLM